MSYRSLTKEELKRCVDDAHYQGFINQNKAKWEAASIAADFEKHK